MIIVKLIRISGIPSQYINQKINIEINENNKNYPIDSSLLLVDEEFECNEITSEENECMNKLIFRIKLDTTLKIIEFNRIITEITERHVIPISLKDRTLNLVFEAHKTKEISDRNTPSKFTLSMDDYVPRYWGCFPYF